MSRKVALCLIVLPSLLFALATSKELGALPGIGPAKAQAIIDGRPYKKTEDVMKVKGIKQGEFNQIRDLITVE